MANTLTRHEKREKRAKIISGIDVLEIKHCLNCPISKYALNDKYASNDNCLKCPNQKEFAEIGKSLDAIAVNTHERKKRDESKLDLTREEYIEMKMDSMTDLEIAESFGVEVSKIKYFKRKNNIKGIGIE